MDKPLSAKIMLAALDLLDSKISAKHKSVKSVRLVMGGGGAMILAHGYPLSTTDIDAVPIGSELSEIDPFIKEISKELSLPGDWLNPYFSTFSHTLPADYASRLVRVFDGKSLVVDALGIEDMLIMKCFAHRAKDIGHARALIKKGANLDLVEAHLSHLEEVGVKEVGKAFEFLNDLIEGSND